MRKSLCSPRILSLFFSLALATVSTLSGASASRIVYPQAVVGPTAQESFEIEIGLGNRNPNEAWQGTVHLLQQADLDGMEQLQILDREGQNQTASQGTWAAVIPPSSSVLFHISSPRLQVGILVIDSEGSSLFDVVPTFFYRLRALGSGKVTDLIPVQPALEPALVYSTLVSQTDVFNVGVALVSEAGIQNAGNGGSFSAELTFQVTLEDTSEFQTQVFLGGSEPEQKALFPRDLLPGLPSRFEGARLTVTGSSPVYCTLLGVGTPPEYEDIQIGATPALVQASARFPLRDGWSLAEGGADLVNGAYWECASPIVREIPGGLTTDAQNQFATVTNVFGPILRPRGDFGFLTRLFASPSSQGGVILVGRLSEGEWWQGLRRLDMAVQNGQLAVHLWNDSSSPVSSTFLGPGTLAGDVQVEFVRSAGLFRFFVNGQEVGQVADPGLFEDEIAYLGLNPTPGSSMAVYGMGAQHREGIPQALEVTLPVSSARVPIQDPSLRAAAEARGIWMGAAVTPTPLLSEESYAQTLGAQFNMLTAENVMKWGPIHPEPDRYSFCPADTLVQFAEANEMQIRGHTLVWHQQVPGWVTQGNYPRDELLAILRNHIRTVVGRYRGRIREWDVVNEAVSDGGGLRNTLWLDVIGSDYIELAFQWAHQEDPSAKLFYNDYSIAEVNAKSTEVYNLLKDLLDRGVPIHGIGFQGHIGAEPGLRPDISSVRANLERFAALGLETNFTEVDVRIALPASAGALAAQAEVYSQLLEACLEATRCVSFVTWGFTDKHSWIPGFFTGYGAALPFDESYQAKEAYHSMLAVLTGS